jgi:membrane-associated phospholipid phosphatase
LRNRHKTGRTCAIFLLLAVLAAPDRLHAQVLPETIPAVEAGDVVALTAGAVVALAPRLFGWGRDSAPCAPCDRAALPAIDRWALHEQRPFWGAVSWVLLGGLVVAGAVDIASQDAGGPYVTGMAESLVWTTAVTEALKAGIGRPRPVMYTARAPEAAASRDNLRSFPSGHASAAFAVATAYWLARRDLTGSPGAAGWAAVGAAGSVALLRVVGGKHFPTDVLAGALLGIAGGAAVHAIKF